MIVHLGLPVHEAVPDSVIDVRRFRPSLIVDTVTEGAPELDWIGSRVGG